MEVPTKAQIGKQTSGGCSIKPPLERSRSKLAHITAILLSNVHQLKCSSLKYMSLPPTFSPPPFDPLNWAYTNHFTVCWLLLPYNTAVTVAVIFLNSVVQLQYIPDTHSVLCLTRHYPEPNYYEYESTPLYLPRVCVCVRMPGKERETFPAAQDYGSF